MKNKSKGPPSSRLRRASESRKAKLDWNLGFGHWKLKSGQVLIIAIVFLAVILIVSASLFSRVADFLRFGTNSIIREQATHLAEAGVDNAIWQLNETGDNCISPYCGSEQVLGSGSFIVTVADKSPILKTITSTGYIPNATSPKSKRTIKTDVYVDSQSIGFGYAVQVGGDGVDMRNSSVINGTVYSNGNIVGSGSSTITGDAYAVGTISSPDPWVQGTPFPGATPQLLPPIDDATIKSDAEAGGTITCPCTFDSGVNPMNTAKYVGDLTIQNTAQMVIYSGPIWVTGNVIVKNTSSIKLDDSFGSLGTYLIADGKVSTDNSGAFIPTNANPKGYILVVTTSTLSDAITIQNTGVNAIFYALSGGALLQNQADVTSLVANSLLIQNNATLTYDTGLAGAQFTNSPGGAWVVKKGTYRFTSSP